MQHPVQGENIQKNVLQETEEIRDLGILIVTANGERRWQCSSRGGEHVLAIFFLLGM